MLAMQPQNILQQRVLPPVGSVPSQPIRPVGPAYPINDPHDYPGAPPAWGGQPPVAGPTPITPAPPTAWPRPIGPAPYQPIGQVPQVGPQVPPNGIPQNVLAQRAMAASY